MEEAAIKAAPVTRLRRRLSAEHQDESNSPTPSTPTKKRGKLAAKPQLDLIEEDGVAESPNKRTTRKSISRDAEADKTLTPSRRITRARSNTSLVDKEDEEKLTPGRRNTRVRSNTSLLAEITAPPADCPRAMRATRRASLLESDNEGGGMTPTKSRRTRKDSTSSADLQATPATAEAVVTVKPAKITRGRAKLNLEDDTGVGVLPKCQVVIEKIPEEEIRDSTSLSKNNDSQISPSSISSSQSSRAKSPSTNTARKSPRLMLKNTQIQTSPDSNATEIIAASKNKSAVEASQGDENVENETISKNHTDGMITKSNIHDLSVSSKNLISNLDKKPKSKKIPGFNKSASAIDSKDQNNRLRTRSCTALVADPEREDSFFSDNEKIKKKQRIISSESKQGSNQNLGTDVLPQKVSSQKKKNDQNNEIIVADSTIETAPFNKSGEELGLKLADTSTDSNKENELSKPKNIASSAAKTLFETNPATSIQTFEIIEDSDSGDNIKVTNEIKSAEDQCVPVIFPEIVTPVPNLFAIQTCDDEKLDNRFIEPMDIDETMPSDVSLTTFDRSRNSSLCIPQNVTSDKKSGRKSSISILSSLNGDHDDSISGDKKSNRKSSISRDDKSKTENSSVKSSNKESPRKSSISNVSLGIEQSEIGNKSTLAVSELNVSAVSADNESKSVKRKKSPRKSSISKDFDKSVTENSNSSRKSSISKDFDKFTTENKSLNVDKNKSPIKSAISLELDKSVAENANLINSSKKSLSKSSISKSLDKSVEATSKDDSRNESILTKVVMDGVPLKNPNKNALIPCVTSTPVQDTAAKKPRIDTSTAVTPVNTKALSESENSTISERSDMNEDSMEYENDLFDNEAMDAGDDYESGDSQDIEERLYEEVNEILDRGETLTSDDNISNDSDYEKDSFLVSSDQEDLELLSGSGDDLDMSINELTMSKKSKKIFNDRKTKEQKTASREMYEARHQLSSQNVNKSGRSRVDSTLLHSEDDNKVPPKKNKRMRIESETSGMKSDLEKSGTENISTANPQIGNTKKKIKPLLESDDETALDENELTIVDYPEIAYREIGHKKKKSKRLSESCNENALNENEMSIIANPEINLENDDPLIVNIKPEPMTPIKDFNMSTVQFTDRQDVEQIEVQENVTMIKSNETSDPLLASFDENDDESISENDEATKNYESILENLNNEHELLTKSEEVSQNPPKNKSKKPKVPSMEELNITKSKIKANKGSQITESGTTKSSQNTKSGIETNKVINIDESSSESIDFKLLFSEESNDGENGGKNNREVTKPPEKNIPLKRSYGKTNLRKTINDEESDTNSEKLMFFTDTVGTYGNANDETMLDSSTTNDKYKKKRTASTSKQKKTTAFIGVKEDAVSMLNISENINEAKVIESASDENQDNITKTLKKQKSFIEDTVDSSRNTSKVKHKKAEASYVEEDASYSTINLKSTNKKKDEGKSDIVKTKNNNKVNTVQDEDSDAPEEISSKKNEFEVEEIPLPKNLKKIKKVKKSDGPAKINESFAIENKTEIGATKTTTSKNKSKRIEASTVDGEIADDSLDKGSKNKSKKSKSKELTDIKFLNEEESNLTPINESKKSKNVSQNNKKTKSSESKVVELMDDSKIESDSSKTKKRKRLLSPQVVEEQEAVTVNHQKKLKIADSMDSDGTKEKKKRREREVGQTFEPQVGAHSRKRKKHDDDFSGMKSKVLKQSSFDEIHVPRLPDVILDQLDDKPRQEVLQSKKSQVVSTSDFNVETTKRRKNKPSDFLEESVFLNHYKSPVMKKEIRKASFPKILPFIPVASTSDKGFTTNFQVKVLKEKVEFVAKAEKNANFKNDYLLERRKKKLRTHDLYKKHRNVKLSKF